MQSAVTMNAHMILVGACMVGVICADAGVQASTTGAYPVYDVRNCRSEDNVDTRQLEILPGLGFDNLRNVDMGHVYLHNYSTCKLTTDGNYLLPDNVLVLPLQEARYKFFADFFDHWDNYTSLTSSSVNFKTSLFGGYLQLGGSFSSEKQSVKENQVNYNTKTTRVTFRNRVYQVILNTQAELHPDFKSVVYEIATNVQNDNIRMVNYLCDLLVRDYGTHYTTSVEAGAVFAKLDFISVEYANNVDITNITSSASFSFPLLQIFSNSSTFNFGFDYRYSEHSIQGYYSNQKRSEIFTIGGASFTPDINFSQWLKDVPNKLANIDRTANPIHFAISPTRFPELPPSTVRVVSDRVLAATERYYRFNTRLGCVDPAAQNFEYDANVGDSSLCDTSTTSINMEFGGLYQTCQSRGREDVCSIRMLAQHNPLTGDFSCPQGYTAISLLTATEQYLGHYTYYYETCAFLGFFCDTESRTRTETSYGDYQTYWCVAINAPPEFRGYLFGGYFTPANSNPVTDTLSCPPYFRKQKIAVDITICLSNDFELGSAHSVRFGGFYSCNVGNPLAVPANTSSILSRTDWPHNCPSGYSQHLVVVASNCEINVCIETGSFNQKRLSPPKLPPFEEQPPFMPYLTEQPTLFTSDGGILRRNIDGCWNRYPPGSKEAIETFNKISPNNNNDTRNSEMDSEVSMTQQIMSTKTSTNPPTAIASLVLSSVAIASVILIVLCLLTYKIYTTRKQKKTDNSNVTATNRNTSDSYKDFNMS